jgi:hypothetical protein
LGASELVRHFIVVSQILNIFVNSETMKNLVVLLMVVAVFVVEARYRDQDPYEDELAREFIETRGCKPIHDACTSDGECCKTKTAAKCLKTCDKNGKCSSSKKCLPVGSK